MRDACNLPVIGVVSCFVPIFAVWSLGPEDILVDLAIATAAALLGFFGILLVGMSAPPELRWPKGVVLFKRLVVWLLETSCEALLLGLFLAIPTADLRDFTKGLLGFTFGIALVSVTTGYVATTGIFRLVISSQGLWLYPIVATILFFIHLQIFIGDGGVFTPPMRLRVRVGGACIVLACTLAGNFALQKWA
jgi:hypothetical protein